MCRSAQANALNRKLLADQVVKCDAGHDDIPPHGSRRLVRQGKVLRQFFKNFEREKRDLSFVVVPVIVKAVSTNSVAGDAFDLRDLDQRMIIRGAAVMTKLIESRGNKDLPDLHRDGEKLTYAETNLANDLGAEALF
jgi:hypothetical protein